MVCVFLLGFLVGAMASDSGNPYLQVLVDKVRLHTTRARAAADLDLVATSLGLPAGTVAPVSTFAPLLPGMLMILRTLRGQVRAA